MEKTKLKEIRQNKNLTQKELSEVSGIPQDINNASRPGRAKFLVKEDDIICARMRDSETNIAIIPKQLDNSLASNGFVVLNPIPPMTKECLYYLLISRENTNQVRWKASGTIMPTVEETEYIKNWLPSLNIDEINNITNEIQKNLDKVFTSIESLTININKKLY